MYSYNFFEIFRQLICHRQDPYDTRINLADKITRRNYRLLLLFTSILEFKNFQKFDYLFNVLN